MRLLRSITPGCLLALCACSAASTRPSSLRELPASDINNCFSRAKQMGAGMLQGTLTLETYVDADGAVPAAWIHDSRGLEYPSFRSCLTDVATAAKFGASNGDYLRAFVITCPPDSVQCSKQAPTSQAMAQLDAKLAQESLYFARWAGPADRGWGYAYTGQYPLAVAAFREALQANPADVRAQRGLAQAMAESGGDLKQARDLAEKAVASQRNAATLEALARVCLQQKDDACAVTSFVEATRAPDRETRSFSLARLNDAARAANERLSATEEQHASDAKRKSEEAAAKADPEGCYKREGGERAVCYVKHCFGAGTVAYASELRKLTGQNIVAGQWSAAGDDEKGWLVTVPLRPASSSRAGKSRKGVPPGDRSMDASWKVTLGDRTTMVAQSLSASNIAKEHNACRK